jgi:predicted O-linked N-acetylglucosamine transferase (SPINDLY family)
LNQALPDNLADDPFEAYFEEGLTQAQHGRFKEAAASFQQALRHRPESAAAHNNLGNVFVEQGKLIEAIDSFRQALRYKPDFASAHSNLGEALRQQGHLAEAVVCLREALHFNPQDAYAHNNLAMVLQAQGKLDLAVESYRRALSCRPAYAEAHGNLGSALIQQGNLEEAQANLHKAVQLRPDYVDAICNLGLVLRKQGRPDEALAKYQQALEIKPDHYLIHGSLGLLLSEQGQRVDDALVAFRASLGLKPDAADVHSNLILTLNYHAGSDARAIHEECSRWNRLHAEPLKQFIQAHGNSPDPERRMRIGYVSPDFREHVDSHFTIPLLSNHDHRNNEIFCYANVPRPDAVSERLRGYADVWRNTVGLSDQELADLVRSDQIDILVDLEMHTGGSRLLMLARKPAPVQVTWLGYPGTTGLSTIDYRLTDPYLDPPGLFDAFYSEESVRLPDTFWCYDPLTDGPPVNSLPALETGVITFGCLNHFRKISEGCLALWADVLREVPRSRLVLLAPRGQAQDYALSALRNRGIVEARIEFIDRVPRAQYLGLYHRIDLALDPLPCNGHTTSLDAFWMGVPVLTLLGRTVMGRAGWSQLCNLGLHELAAEMPEEYLAMAAELAGDLPRLQELRSTLRQQMQQSPLMDGRRFAGHVEQAYRQMWRRWCER